MLKENVKTKNTIKSEKKNNLIRKIPTIVVAAIISLSAISIAVVDQAEKKINSVPEQNINEFKEIISVTMDDQKFYNYADNFNYTEAMQKEDLTLYDNFQLQLLKKYHKILTYNNVKDIRTDDKILSSMKNQFGVDFAENFIYFYHFDILKDNSRLFDLVFLEYTDHDNYILNEKNGKLSQYIKTNGLNKIKTYEITDFSIKEQYFKNTISAAARSYAKHSNIVPNYYSFYSDNYKNNVFIDKRPKINYVHSILIDFKNEEELIKENVYKNNLTFKEGAVQLKKLQNNYINHSFSTKEQVLSFLKLTRINDSLYHKYHALKNNDDTFNEKFFNNVFFNAGIFLTKGHSVNYNDLFDHEEDTDRSFGIFKNKHELLLHLSGYKNGILKYEKNK